MNAHSHISGELTSWSCSDIVSLLTANGFAAGVVCLAFLGFIGAWIVRPIIGEYVKIWHFNRIPPWLVHRLTLSDLKRREAALANREREFDAHLDAVGRALDRAERIEAAYIALKAERGEANVVQNKDCRAGPKACV